MPNDLEKIIALFYVAEKSFGFILVNSAIIHWIVFLCNRSNAIKFAYASWYSFPMPTSPSLDEDLDNLSKAGYLERVDDCYSISEKGKTWIEKQDVDMTGFCQEMECLLSVYLFLTPNEFFSAIYASY